jgi:phosphatidylglycerol lysyltransferase
MEPKLARYLGPLIAVILFAAALWVLHRQLAEHRLVDVVREVGAIPVSKLLFAVGLSALGYLVLTGYDALSLRYVHHPLPYHRVALAAFVAYAFSHNIGLGLLTGGSIRYRLYSAWGLSAGEVTRVVGFGALTLGLGFVAVAGAVLILEPLRLPDLFRLPLVSLRPVGVAFLLVAIGYVLWTAVRRRPITIRGWQIALPSPLLALSQIAIASLDWGIAAAVLYALLPTTALSYPEFLGVFLIAAGMGILSHIPGGLGVFETVVLLLLPPRLPTPAVFGALLAYRIIYYFLPLGIAAVLLASHEIQRGRESVRRLAGTFGRWATVLAPPVFALVVFVAGAILLFSGATPAVGSRLARLHDLLPLPLIEISHFLGSLAGAGLLLLARGLQRRLDGAYLVALVLLGAGILFSLLKGLDYEEASILAVMLAALWPCRRFFYRRASLTAQSFTPGWSAAIATVVLASLWLGLFAHKHVPYANELWWSFALEGDAPRFLRASVGAVAIILIFAAARLLGAAPPEPSWPSPEALERAAAIAAQSRRTEANLALLGDKSLLFSASGTAFLMYGVAGQSWVSMGDPVGPQEERWELAWQFRELSDRHGGRTVFYEVGTIDLPLYLDLGLTLLKLGEGAQVSLHTFSLEGSARKELRYVHRRLAKEGCRFELVPPDGVALLLPELEAVSDAWLREKHVREKGFSLGRFAPGYLRRFPIGLIRKEGQIIAFANMWQGGGMEELSIDLMRHLPEAPRGIMDFLFTEIMLWGKAAGYRSFSLGMAPLSGLEDRALAPSWSRIGAYVFRHGEHFYNFRGLRQYKEKFDPVWEPRYLAAPGGIALPRVLADVAALISGGLRGLVSK